MLKYHSYIIVFHLFLFSFPAFSQSSSAGSNRVYEEKEKFLRNLKFSSQDSTTVHSLSHFFASEVDSIYTSIRNDELLPPVEKEKAARSLVFLIEALNKDLLEQKPGMYEVPEALLTYKRIYNALLHHRPLTQILTLLPSQRSQLMAVAFSQYKEFSLIDDVAVYKRVSAAPEFILQFLESKPGFRYADSLLLDAAVHDPVKMIYYLNNSKPGVQDKIRNTSNIYLKQIAVLAEDKNASELFPFVTQIAERTMTVEEILEQRKETISYFQLMVNTLQESLASHRAVSSLLKPLRSGIKQKGLYFYVNEINDQHAASEAIRFASVKNLRPQDLYYIITSCGEELYTSSYLGLYKRLMDQFKDATADSLFELVQFDNLRVFIRLAANYNVLANFLGNLSPDKRTDVIRRFIEGIDTDENSGLGRSMDIADSFTSLRSSPEISEVMEAQLRIQLNRATTGQNYLGIRLYGILLELLNLVKEENGMQKLWAKLGNYELLKHKELENEKGQIVQLVLFYGDEDGVGVFNGFLRRHGDKTKWEISKNKNWVSIRSLAADHPLLIYANVPLDIKEQLDIAAQDSLMDYLRSQSLEPVILIHRGHSYHLDKSIKRLTAGVRLAILGSCGSYNKAISLSTMNPEIQVIGSKKMGTSSVNNPIIDAVNESLLNGNDLSWPEIWQNLAKRFNNDETTLTLFNEYFPPNNNLSLFFLKLFKNDIRLYSMAALRRQMQSF